MTLQELLSQTKRSEFEFVNIQKDYAEDGSKLAIFTLKTAIPEVTGSQTVTDGVNTERVSAFDVTSVKMHEEDIAELGENEFTLNADGKSGKISTDLRLDVAKRSGDVWLKSTSFAASGREMRESKQLSRRDQLMAAINKRKEDAKPSSPVVNAPKAEAPKVQPVVTK
jgi:hypothetical protein